MDIQQIFFLFGAIVLGIIIFRVLLGILITIAAAIIGYVYDRNLYRRINEKGNPKIKSEEKQH